MNLVALIEQVQAALDLSPVQTGHGTLNNCDEAHWLVLWRLGLPLDADPEALAFENPSYQALSESDIQDVMDLTQERISSRKPLAYLTREAWLQGVPFYIDERAIVPRSLIAEVLCSGSLAFILGFEPESILDLCTGNGSLAVLAALHWPTAKLEGLDISEPALEVAKINGTRHSLDSRIDWRLSDGLKAAQGAYDLILCNPPYVPTSSMMALPLEFQREPELALGAGEDGMDFIRQVLPHMHHHLTPRGFLVLELGHEIETFAQLYPQLPWISFDTQLGNDQVLGLSQLDLKSYFEPTPTSHAQPVQKK